MYILGRDLIDFVTTNKLEDSNLEYEQDYDQIKCTIDLIDGRFIEYVMYLEDGKWSITLVEDEDEDEDELFCYIEPDYALKLRGLAE